MFKNEVKVTPENVCEFVRRNRPMLENVHTSSPWDDMLVIDIIHEDWDRFVCYVYWNHAQYACSLNHSVATKPNVLYLFYDLDLAKKFFVDETFEAKSETLISFKFRRSEAIAHRFDSVCKGCQLRNWKH